MGFSLLTALVNFNYILLTVFEKTFFRNFFGNGKFVEGIGMLRRSIL